MYDEFYKGTCSVGSPSAAEDDNCNPHGIDFNSIDLDGDGPIDGREHPPRCMVKPLVINSPEKHDFKLAAMGSFSSNKETEAHPNLTALGSSMDDFDVDGSINPEETSTGINFVYRDIDGDKTNDGREATRGPNFSDFEDVKGNFDGDPTVVLGEITCYLDATSTHGPDLCIVRTVNHHECDGSTMIHGLLNIKFHIIPEEHHSVARLTEKGPIDSAGLTSIEPTL